MGRCPKRLTKHLGRNGKAKNVENAEKGKVLPTDGPTDIAGYRVASKRLSNICPSKSGRAGFYLIVITV